MANRSMIAKTDRARRQSIEAARAFADTENAKPDIRLHHAICAAEKRDLAELVAAYKGPITKCPPADKTYHRDIGREGKRRASRQTRTYGNGERIVRGLSDYF